MYALSFEQASIRNGLRLGIRRRPQIRPQRSAQDPPARDQHARSTPDAQTSSSSAVVSRRATSIPESVFSHRWETSVPTSSQLHQAERFFLSHSPVLLYSSSKFRTIDSGTALEVAFLGRSNVGKSSLLNALMGRNICYTSSKPGRTKTMNFFAVGGEDQAGNPGKVVVLDMPGHGKGSREEWGQEIMKYLVGRKQYGYIPLLEVQKAKT
jgi:GTP-binding protein